MASVAPSAVAPDSAAMLAASAASAQSAEPAPLGEAPLTSGPTPQQLGKRLSARLSIRRSVLSRSSSIEFLPTEVRSAFDPNSRGIQVWRQLLLAALIYEVVVLPFIAVFRRHDQQWHVPECIMIYVCELLFLADIYAELNMGYYEDGNVMMDASKSRVKYLKSPRFVLDTVALLPLSLLYPALSHTEFAPVFLEFHKFLRVRRLPKYVAMLDDIYARHFVVLKMFKVLLVTLLLSHNVACLRFLFGYNDHHDDHWLPHEPTSTEEIQDHSPYLMSLFWAFGLLTGLFEGELPTTIFEFLFTIFVALCGFSLFTYVCATFFMISKCESGHLETSEARINQLKHLLSFHHVPDTLQSQAIEYTKKYHTQSESNDREVVKLLCPSIAKDIQVELLKEMVGNVPFLKDCNQQFIIAVTSLLEMISLPANMVVFNVGDAGDAMYVINSGVLHVMVKGIKIREMRKGAFFGEMAVFLRRPRYATVVTSTYCTLYKLVRFHVERLFEGYPEYATVIPKRVEEMARTLFGRISGEANIVPDKNLVDGDNDGRKVEGKKLFANLIRKHAKKGKSKVSPDAGIICDAIYGTTANSSPSPTSMMLLAARALKKCPADTEHMEVGDSNIQISPAAKDEMPLALNTEKSVSTRPPAEVAPPLPSDLSRSTEKVTPALSELYSQVDSSPSRTRRRYWWSSILLTTAIDNESKRRVWWLALLQVVLIYNWFLIPVQLAFLALRRNTWYIMTFNIATDLVLWADVYINLNLSYIDDSEKIWDTTRAAVRYAQGWLLADIACVFPYWFFAQATHHAIPRVPRLLRVLRLQGHLREVEEFVKFTGKQRLLLLGALLVVLYHIVACLHFSVTYIEGFSHSYHAWIPSDDVYLASVNASHCVDKSQTIHHVSDDFVFKLGMTQYFRSLYYAANVLAALGLTIEPASDIQYGVALLFMLSGFFITAIVVDNVQKRFTASAFEQKEFFATRSQIQLFLRRQNAPMVIHKRVNAFLDYWWCSHRGAVISELLDELPESIKQEILQNICKPVLQTLALLNGVRPVLSDLEHVFIDNARFILYGQGEIVYRLGDFASGLFFLLTGEICIIAKSTPPRSIHQGGFFGTAALNMDGTAVSYSERVTATSGCMVLFVSRQHIQAMIRVYPSLVDSLRALEKRFLDPKLARASIVSVGGDNPIEIRGNRGILSKLIAPFDRVFDPDSLQMLAWETWLFLIMTAEWILIMFYICFGLPESRASTVDSMLMLIEVHFVLDIYIRSHLGYVEFGNKVMASKRIRERYFRSWEFGVDLVAIIPLFMINWGLHPSRRNEALNFNKMIRLSKVPMQFLALENKFIKRTLELRLFKLVYYTFLLTHLLGCVWFDFASNASNIHSLVRDETDNATLKSAFGAFPWMPPASLENASPSLQYFASLFWSFGLMSASSTGELPKTVAQSLCSIVTMTSGFFLFAYVIGNFSDTIELMDAENREFFAKLSSLRHLISHFKLPVPIAEKFKNYYFFKRFHSITQEHILERCLPPSLLTDIRMVHLQPMIAKVTFLAGMDASVTRMLVAQFSQELVVKDEFVYKFGEQGSDMYFVFTGVLFTLLPPEEFARESSVIERKATLLSGRLAARSEILVPNASVQSAAPSVPVLTTMATTRNASQLTKLNVITAGNYFGENVLFFNSVRTSSVQASTSCILYSLSRQSLELVFDRYPDWKAKVLRIATINQEQQRLNRLAQEEEKNTTVASMVAQAEQLTMRTECTEEELRRMKSISAKRKASRTASALLPEGLDTVNDAGSFLSRNLSLPAWLRGAVNGTTAQSRYHLIWLRVITVTTIYVSVLVPYRISFDSLMRPGSIPILCRELELLCEFIFLVDVWFNWRLKGSHESMELYEQDHRRSYVKERLLWDLLAALPVDYVLYSQSPSPWYRINRCLKMVNLVHYMHEINRRSISNELKRLRIACLMYTLLIYWSACAYFVIAIYDRYGVKWNEWLPSSELEITDPDHPSTKLLTLRLLRGLFYATTAFVKKGKTFTPESTPHLVFAIVTCFVGLLVMAFMLGEIASLYISYIGNEVDYRKKHIAVELYLGRWRTHGELRARMQAFLSSLWSSHRGVDYQSLLENVPASVRMESVLAIAHSPLEAFTNTVFGPLGHSCASEAQQTASIETLTQGLAQRLKFEGYPRDECVLVEGSISKAMYFVVRGHLRSASRSHPTVLGQVSFVKGDYFGEAGLLGYSVSAFTVKTMRACDLLSLSADALLDVLHAHPTYQLALKLADRAACNVKQEPLAANAHTTESRWGEMLIDAVNEERHLCDQPSMDVTTRRQMKKTRAVLDRQFVTRTPNECYAFFRPLLQVIVPNGFLHLHGGPPTLAKQSSLRRSLFDCDWSSASALTANATLTADIRLGPLESDLTPQLPPLVASRAGDLHVATSERHDISARTSVVNEQNVAEDDAGKLLARIDDVRGRDMTPSSPRRDKKQATVVGRQGAHARPSLPCLSPRSARPPSRSGRTPSPGQLQPHRRSII